jgi:iron complex transport system permease protein
VTVLPAPAPSGPAVARLRRRRLTGLAVLLVLLVVCAALSVAVGTRPLGLGEVLTALTSPTGSDTDVVVRSLRVPRTLLGLLVGAALGAAGALAQGHTRNPLADPGLLGVSAGAALAVVLAIQVLGVGSPSGYLWFSFAGALAASVLVFGLGAVAGRAGDPLTLALAGAAVTASLGAVTSALVLLDRTTLDGFRFWVVGSVAGRGTDVLLPVAPFLVVGLVLALAGAPALNVLGLGEDVARSLGLSVVRSRVLGVLTITLLTGAATAACGPLGFLGLVVPHVARAVTGPDHRWLVPFSALGGAVLLLAADVLGRVVVRPGELQVGVVLAVVGAPFFVALVRRRTLVRL